MKIYNNLQSSIPVDVVKIIKKLLKRVPPEHLVGLDGIIACDYVTFKKNRNNVAGIYNPKSGHEPATIEVAIKMIYKGSSRVFFYIPFFYKFLLASVLYHEIGHHTHYIKAHGVKKHEGEKFANKYKRTMLRKNFFWWGILFVPFAPLIHWLNRIINKNK